ncbi:MAG: hypothetical protein KDI15_07070, partial [Thiothrix sp.]|nr:hypothetical protein [Thiothrix sp.]
MNHITRFWQHFPNRLLFSVSSLLLGLCLLWQAGPLAGTFPWLTKSLYLLAALSGGWLVTVWFVKASRHALGISGVYPLLFVLLITAQSLLLGFKGFEVYPRALLAAFVLTMVFFFCMYRLGFRQHTALLLAIPLFLLPFLPHRAGISQQLERAGSGALELSIFNQARQQCHYRIPDSYLQNTGMQLAPDSELILQLTNPDLPVVTLIRNLDTSRDFPDEMLAVLLTLPPAEIRHGLRIYRADSVPDLPDPQLQAAALAGFKAFREILLPEGLLPGFYFLCSPGSTR